jgi:hypothetical protein
MSDNSEPTTVTEDNEPEDIKHMRELAKAAPTLMRENAMLKALGPDVMKTKLGLIFAQNYQGDIDNPEGITAEFQQMRDEILEGIIPAESPSPPADIGEEVPDPVLNSARDNLSTSVSGLGEDTTRPAQDEMESAGMEEFRARLQEGVPREEAMKSAWAGIFAQQGMKKL